MQEARFQTLSESNLTKLRNGVPLDVASALLVPEAWETYHKNYPNICVLGDAESGRRYIAGAAAHDELARLMLQLALEGKIALKVLDPPGLPTARWVSLSVDVLRALDPAGFNIGQSKVHLTDGPKLEVRVFYPPGSDPTADSTFHKDLHDAPSAAPKLPAKVRVPKAWERLPEETKGLVNAHGGKRRIALILWRELPDLAVSTIERELHRLRPESPP